MIAFFAVFISIFFVHHLFVLFFVETSAFGLVDLLSLLSADIGVSLFLGMAYIYFYNLGTNSGKKILYGISFTLTLFLVLSFGF